MRWGAWNTVMLLMPMACAGLTELVRRCGAAFTVGINHRSSFLRGNIIHFVKDGFTWQYPILRLRTFEDLVSDCRMVMERRRDWKYQQDQDLQGRWESESEINQNNVIKRDVLLAFKLLPFLSTGTSSTPFAPWRSMILHATLRVTPCHSLSLVTPRQTSRPYRAETRPTHAACTKLLM